MNRHKCITLMVAAGVALGMGGTAYAQADAAGQLLEKTNQSIAVAAAAVEEARVAIANGKKLIELIPADSASVGEVQQMLVAASKNWQVAISALNGAKQSAAKIASASNDEFAEDYALLAKVNAGVALSGAEVVKTGLLFVDAVANNKTEALDIIRMAMQDSLAAASQVQFNYERIKTIILDKYSKEGVQK